MSKQFEERIKAVRWQVGNERHIDIVRRLGEVNTLKRELAAKKKEVKGIDAVTRKIKALEEDILKRLDYASSL